MNIEEFFQNIQQVSFFKGLLKNEEFLDRLHSYCKKKIFPINDVIIHEGERGGTMYMGISGSIEVSKMTRAGDIFTLSPSYNACGVTFGELSMIDNVKRSATVSATSRSEFYTIEKKFFEALCRDFPNEGMLIMEKLARRLSGYLRETNDNMLALFDALVDEVKYS